MAMTQKPNPGLIRFSAIFFFFFCGAILPSEAVSNPDTQTLYELLARHGLPSGLFPDSVVNYVLSSNGRLVINLKKACYIHSPELLYYHEVITGVLGEGFLTQLKGIQVRSFFFWPNLDEISVDVSPPNIIYLNYGGSIIRHDVNKFKTVQTCKDSVMASRIRSFNGALQLPVNNKAEDLWNGTRSDAS